MSSSDIYSARVPRRTSRHKIRGIDFAVSEWGDAGAPTMFWLHGWGDCSATLQFVVDELEGDWHVVAPDLRGFGETRLRASAYWFPDYLADADQLFELYQPQERICVAGHSMGGNIASLYAGCRPERVAALVNVEGFGLKDGSPEDTPAHYASWLAACRDMPGYQTYEDFSGLAARVRLRSPTIRRDRAEFVARCWAEDTGERIELKADPRHKSPNAVQYRRAEAEACWAAIEAPVTLVAGRESAFLKHLGVAFENGNIDLPYPDARSEILDDAGHMIHFERPAALAAILEAAFTKPL